MLVERIFYKTTYCYDLYQCQCNVFRGGLILNWQSKPVDFAKNLSQVERKAVRIDLPKQMHSGGYFWTFLVDVGITTEIAHNYMSFLARTLFPPAIIRLWLGTEVTWKLGVCVCLRSYSCPC